MIVNNEGICAVFESLSEWMSVWECGSANSAHPDPVVFREIAHFVGGAMSTHGFKLFENGGTPLIERYVGPYREEVLLVPAPKMVRRAELPFAVRVHLSSSAISRVRSRFWRPPTRAPHMVARGDLGQFYAPERRIIWFGSGGVAVAERISEELARVALPWFECFRDRSKMKARLFAGKLDWIDECTALELLLSEFDPYEARRYRRLMISREDPKTAVAEPSGFEVGDDRFAPITTYYRL